MNTPNSIHHKPTALFDPNVTHVTSQGEYTVCTRCPQTVKWMLWFMTIMPWCLLFVMELNLKINYCCCCCCSYYYRCCCCCCCCWWWWWWWWGGGGGGGGGGEGGVGGAGWRLYKWNLISFAGLRFLSNILSCHLYCLTIFSTDITPDIALLNSVTGDCPVMSFLHNIRALTDCPYYPAMATPSSHWLTLDPKLLTHRVFSKSLYFEPYYLLGNLKKTLAR